MSLATRCTACGTVFRVVQDQLRVSGGWVRCGRCNAVFDATEVLFDIDSGAAIRLPPQAGGPGEPAIHPATAAAATAPHRPSSAPGVASALDPAATVGDAALSPAPLEPHEPLEPMWAEPLAGEFSVDRAWLPPAQHQPLLRAPSRGHDEDDQRIVITDHVPSGLSATEPALLAGAAGLASAAAGALRIEPTLQAPAAARAASAFLRASGPVSGWRRPLQRAGLWLAALALTLAALLQGALLWRDALAASWPLAKPALQSMCRVAGCTVQPLRRLDALAVESSGLNRVEGSTLYRLQLVLRNQGATVVMLPSLDLALNDGQGQLVARRALAIAEMGPPQTALAPGQTLPLAALLSTSDRRIDGYTLELFYP